MVGGLRAVFGEFDLAGEEAVDNGAMRRDMRGVRATASGRGTSFEVSGVAYNAWEFGMAEAGEVVGFGRGM